MSTCQECGACCAAMRVGFPKAEVRRLGVPPERTVPLPAGRLAMRGTTDPDFPRCEALRGRVGDCVECVIYAQRPSPCRDFAASWSNGEANPECDQARAVHGLRPLARPDEPPRLPAL